MMRDTPRHIPLRYRVSILCNEVYFFIGSIFLAASLLALFFAQKRLAEGWFTFIIMGLMIWGTALIIYSLRKGLRIIKILVWGKLIFGKLLKRRDGVKGMDGQVIHQATFSFPFELKTLTVTLEIKEAFEMEEEQHYLLLINEEDPKQLVCIEQFSKPFNRYFHRAFKHAIEQAVRQQRVNYKYLD